MNQIVCNTMKIFIKQELEQCGYARCGWKTEPINEQKYCHFLTDIGCGFWNPEPYFFDLPQRKEFYKCDLPQMRLKI